MNIQNKLDSAKELDFFSELSLEEKQQADFLADIAILIHDRRIELGMTQSQFAALNHVSQSIVSKWESGDYNFTVGSLLSILSTIGLKLSFSATQRNIEICANPFSPQCDDDKWECKSSNSSKYNNRTTSPAFCFATGF